jgi:hypothetical protein
MEYQMTKTKSLISLSILVGLVFVSACGSNPIDESIKQSEKTLSEVNATYQTSGVKECDEVIALINKGLENPEEGYLARAARELLLNTAREEISKMVEMEKDKTKLAQSCADVKARINSGLLGGQN